MRNPIQIIKELKPELIALDTETFYNPLNKDALVITIKEGLNNEPFCVTCYFEKDGKEYGFYIDDMQVAKKIIEDESTAKIFHNFKYDYHMLANIGITVKGTIIDTMVMINLIDEEHECEMPAGNKKKSSKLKDLAYHYLDKDAHQSEMDLKEVRMEIAKINQCKLSQVSYNQAYDYAPEKLKTYAIKDVEYTYKLYWIFMQEIANQRLYRPMEIDLNATRAIINIERQGIRLDIKAVEENKRKLLDIGSSIMEEIHIVGGFDDLNLNSNRDIAEMYSRMGVKWVWLTDSGEYDTAKETLIKIRDLYAEHEQIIRATDLLLEYRKTEKLITTYVGYDAQSDGKVHPSYWIIGDDFGKGGTVTGRLSSSNPKILGLTLVIA